GAGHLEVQPEGSDDPDDDEDRDDVAAAPHVGQPLPDLPLPTGGVRQLVQLVLPHEGEGQDRGGEAQRVDDEDPSRADDGDEQAGDAGPDEPGGVEGGAVEPDGV